MRILITAGPTQEPIDAVRFIGNRSSGRMGTALAGAAAEAGHDVTLLLGPGGVDLPGGEVTVHGFRTTSDLQKLLQQQWPDHDVLLMAAAVADFRPVGKVNRDGKIRRDAAGLTLTLEPTPDLLAELARGCRSDQLIVGFALEPAAELRAKAREKLRRKGIHAIVANPLETMDSDRIAATVFLRDGRELTPPTPAPPAPGAAAGMLKDEFARWLVGLIPDIRAARGQDGP